MYIMSHQIKRLQKQASYKSYLNMHDTPTHVLKAMDELEIEKTKILAETKIFEEAKAAGRKVRPPNLERMTYIKGVAVSGGYLMESNHANKKPETMVEEIEKMKESTDKRRHQQLYQHNVYKLPVLFRERVFDEDSEGSNFFIMDKSLKSRKAIQVYPR